MSEDTTLEKFGARIGGIEIKNAVVETRVCTIENTLKEVCNKLDAVVTKVTVFTGIVVAFVIYVPKLLSFLNQVK